MNEKDSCEFGISLHNLVIDVLMANVPT